MKNFRLYCYLLTGLCFFMVGVVPGHANSPKPLEDQPNIEVYVASPDDDNATCRIEFQKKISAGGLVVSDNISMLEDPSNLYIVKGTTAWAERTYFLSSVLKTTLPWQKNPFFPFSSYHGVENSPKLLVATQLLSKVRTLEKRITKTKKLFSSDYQTLASLEQLIIRANSLMQNPSPELSKLIAQSKDCYQTFLDENIAPEFNTKLASPELGQETLNNINLWPGHNKLPAYLKALSELAAEVKSLGIELARLATGNNVKSNTETNKILELLNKVRYQNIGTNFSTLIKILLDNAGQDSITILFSSEAEYEAWGKAAINDMQSSMGVTVHAVHNCNHNKP